MEELPAEETTRMPLILTMMSGRDCYLPARDSTKKVHAEALPFSLALALTGLDRLKD